MTKPRLVTFHRVLTCRTQRALCFGWYALAALLISQVASSAWAAKVRVSADSITYGDAVAKSFAASIDSASGTLRVTAQSARTGNLATDTTALECRSIRVTPAVACEGLSFQGFGESLTGRAELSGAGLIASLAAAPHGATADRLSEAIEIKVNPDRTAHARLKQLQLARVNSWLPKDQPAITAGQVGGEINFTLPRPETPVTFQLAVEISSAAFADKAGLRAGEKLGLTIAARGAQIATGWQLTGAIRQTAGEVFWQPVYLGVATNGVTFDVDITSAGYRARALQLTMGGMGSLSASGRGRWDAKSLAQGVEAAKIVSNDLDLTRIYLDLVKPIAAGSLLAELDVTGRAKLELDVAGGQASRVLLRLSDVTVNDPRGRIGVTQLSTDLPWVRGESTGATLRWQSAKFYKIPIGPARLPIALSPEAIEMRYVRIPILDGALELDRLAGDRADGSWPIVLAGRITPIAMPALTQALGMPAMAGTLAAELPGMIYHQRALTINGEFTVRVFDGDIAARNIHVEEALGKSPRMTGEIAARNLDLGLITQTFKFGRMEGRIDAEFADMELVNWRPNQLNARIASSPGDYRKKISQQAVQNISSLGGAGAAAAIQRSVLRFFEEFGYQKLGLTCKLSAAVCEMGGIETAPQGYVLVKGGGIPAISVLGYNRRVSWQELVRRVSAAIESNEKPIIK